MSTQPVSVNPRRQAEVEKIKELQQRHARRADLLYIAGAALVVAGAGMIRLYLAPIAAGCFCLVFPAIDLVTGFVRGARPSVQGRR
jgi:hypothetical protein